MLHLSVKHALTQLTRLAQRRPQETHLIEKALAGRLEQHADPAIAVAIEYGDPIGQVVAKGLREKPDSILANRIYDSIPDETVALRELDAEAARQCLEAARQETPENRPAVAVWAGNYGIRLARLGCLEQSLALLSEALDLYRSLLDIDALAALGVARTLNDIATTYQRLGHRRMAAEAAREAVRIYQPLAKKWPDRFERALEVALQNLGTACNEAGDYQEALSTANNILSFCEEQKNLSGGTAAAAMIAQSNALSGIGLIRDAAASAEKAVQTIRDLDEAHEDAFRPTLLLAFGTFANRLAELGEIDRALDIAAEALEVARALASARPGAFAANLAMSLHDYSLRLSDAGRPADALVAIEEALVLRRSSPLAPLADIRGDLALFENTYSNRLSQMNRTDEGIAAAKRSAQLYRDLAAELPGRYAPELGTSLTNLANRYREIGLRDDAVAVAREACSVLERLVNGSDGSAQRPKLALALANFSSMMLDSRRYKEALVAAQSSLGLFKQLTDEFPKKFAPQHAWALMNLAGALEPIDAPKALETARKSLQEFRALEKPLDPQVAPIFVTALSNQAAREIERDRPELGLALADEGIAIMRVAQTKGLRNGDEALALALGNRSQSLEALGRLEDADTSALEQINIYRTLHQLRPDAYDFRLSQALNNYGNLLSKMGRLNEAVAISEESAEIRRNLVLRFPRRFERNLATTLVNLANRYSDLAEKTSTEALGQEKQKLRQSAVTIGSEASNLFHEINESGNLIAESELAFSLRNLAIHCKRVGRLEEAIRSARWRRDLCWNLMARSPVG